MTVVRKAADPQTVRDARWADRHQPVIRKNNVVSERPVKVKMIQGTLNANRLEVVDSGDLVRFGGGVDMVLMLNHAGAPSSKSGEP